MDSVKTIRPLDEVLKDLNAVAKDIESKKNKLEELSKSQSHAFNELENAYKSATRLKAEMEEFLNLLVPPSEQNRIRQSK